MKEVERRYADQSPAWGIARLAAVQNLRQLWAESAAKRKHDHRLQYRAMGHEDILGTQEEEEVEMPGDINIYGDSYDVRPQQAAAPATPANTTTTATATTTDKPTGWLPTALVALGIVAASGLGAGATYLWNQYNTPATSTDTDTDTDSYIDVHLPP